MKEKFMSDTSLDLFCDHIDAQLADEYAIDLEAKAAELEITVDYYIAEFL
jgi:hypothetical protein